MRAVDYLFEQPEIDPSRIFVVGLSMGGEVSTFAAALDPRLAMSVTAGFSPDLSVVLYRGSHGCWQWAHGDIREYLDVSDLHALIAPRPLVVETGREDWTYSFRAEPFAADKQVMRRSRPFWSDAPDRVIHYLHYDIHHFHAGDGDPLLGAETDVREPVFTQPVTALDLAWQSDGTTSSTGLSLFDEIERWVLPHQ
jgi:hypothetical protein